jgi:hypothetical protein
MIPAVTPTAAPVFVAVLTASPVDAAALTVSTLTGFLGVTEILLLKLPIKMSLLL